MATETLDSGRKILTLTNIELSVLAAQAWNASQLDDLLKLRAEAARRGLKVA